MVEKRYIIGIDTGGTYTDGVILEKESRKILAAAKQPTTHNRLSDGTGSVLSQLLGETGISAAEIDSLSVSSTLATNSVVENKGARVALLVIGYVRHFKLPVKAVVFIKGGHTITGQEEEPLDLDYLVEIVSNLKDEVDAYGVCSAMSIKNPAHELVAEKAISLLDPKPVFCSHRTSSAAGMRERAATAGLHAKLMPVMEEYIGGVGQAMEELGLTCPMLVVSGSGHRIKSAEAVEFAGSTVASGPACTALFGADHTNEDALVIDVGGTTTDIAMLQDGKPLLASEGCRIGQWRTHVEAVDMVTGGVGGDSHVLLSSKFEMKIGPSRVVPLAMAEAIPPAREWLGSEEAGKLIVFREGSEAEDDEVSRYLRKTMGATPADIRAATSIAGITLEKQLERMFRNQQIFECGFTPTDALHVLGRIDIGDRQKSLEGALMLSKAMGMDPESFSRLVLEKTEEKIENLVVDYVINHFWGKSLAGFLSERNAHPVLGVNFSLKIPMIGIGASAPHLLPNIAEKLGTSVIFPDHGEVGNAVGAALIGLG